MTIELQRFVLGALLTNVYLLVAGGEAMLIDPAVSSREICDVIEHEGLYLRYIVNTHGHIDHIGGNAFFKERFPQAQLLVHERDLLYLQNPALNLSTELGEPYVSPSPDLVIRGLGTYSMTIFEEEVVFVSTPGHTPGSMCLFLPGRKWLFSGDTLFAGSVGRVDLPGGSFRDLLASLAVVFEQFPDETLVYPGHGPETTIGREKRENFYYLEYVVEKP
ncbi:MAG: MBL fold metallo-hydrolase [Atribacterota bacterium]|nr:MBL fold metallo-hydrolase [Atribacterota bacterium]